MSAESPYWLHNNTLVGYRIPWWANDEILAGMAESPLYPGAIPVDDVIRRLFNFTVEESPIHYHVPSVDGAELILHCDPTRKVMYRSDTSEVLGMFKDSYQGHSYKEWLVETVGLILDDGLNIGSAGLLRNGAQAYVQVEVPDNIVTPEGVVFRPNLLACTSYDGTLATTYKRTITNVVCDNTMAAGLSEVGQQYKVKHSKYSAAKLDNARDALAIVHTMSEDFASEVAMLCNVDVTDKQWAKVLDVLAPLPLDDSGAEIPGRGLTQAENKRSELSRLYSSDPRVSPWKNTAYGVLQCVNTYSQHSAIVRGDGDSSEAALASLRAMRNAEKTVKGAYDELDKETFAMLSSILPKSAFAIA